MMTTALDPNPARVPGGIGAALRRIDGPLKVTGGARYASDMSVNKPVYAYFHTSAISLGKITAIDDSEARTLKGVIDVMTWKNSAGQFEAVKIFTEGGPASTSIMPLQSPDISHDSEVVAVILAESYEVARDASHRLVVTYQERKPTATFGSEGLVAAKLPKENPQWEDIKVGNAEDIFAKSKVKIDQRYATPTQHHNPIELFTTTAAWEGDKLTIYEPSQFMVGMQNGLASQLRHDPSKTHFISHYVGGAFGSKGAIGPRTALIALAAKRLNRPVKFVSTRDQGFTLATHRAETQQRVRLSASADGLLTSFQHDGEEVTSRKDDYAVVGTDVTARVYAIPNIATHVIMQHADRDTPGFMRAPAEVPYMFALESAMDELAYELNIDPVKLRQINDAKVDPVNQHPFSSRSLVQCFDAAAAAFGWSKRNPKPLSTVEGDWQVGWGCATAVYPSNIAASFARVTLMQDGARVEVAGHEMGTGAYTIYAQVAADRLGVPVEKVQVLMGDSRLPPAPIAGGSNNAASISNAVAMGCAMIRTQMAAAAVADAKSPFKGQDPVTLKLVEATLLAPNGVEETLAVALARSGGAIEVLAGNEPESVEPGSLAGLRTGQLGFGGGTSDKKFTKMAFGAEFVEVRVHKLTREVRVPRIVGAFAAGTIMNPMTARSQLLGGMIWGISSALHEATEIDHRNARYTNNNLAEYLIPVNADVPSVEVIFVPEKDTEVNPLGIKGIGELGGVGTNAAMCNALYHATGIRIRELPIRIEKLLT